MYKEPVKNKMKNLAPLFFWVASKSYLGSDIPLLGSITIH